MTEHAQNIEALLFVAGQAVPYSELAALLQIDEKTVRTAVGELASTLEGHGISLVTTQDAVQLTTAPSVGEFLASFDSEEERPLSKAATETLSIIAYKGPITRYDVDVIRGVDSSRMIRSLMRRGLIRHIRDAGKTPTYDVTQEFLQHMGITSKHELPRFNELSDNEKIASLLET